MTKDEALRLALEFIPSISPAFICEASHHKKHEQHASNEPCPHVAKQKQVYEAIKAALEAKDEPMKKLQVTLEDRPVDIELAQYKRMFEDACSTLGAVSHALGCDPDEGGAEPLLAAIEELKGQTTPPQRRPLTDEEIDKVMAENKQTLIDATDNYWNMRRAYARIIEAAHGIKGEA